MVRAKCELVRSSRIVVNMASSERKATVCEIKKRLYHFTHDELIGLVDCLEPAADPERQRLDLTDEECCFEYIVKSALHNIDSLTSQQQLTLTTDTQTQQMEYNQLADCSEKLGRKPGPEWPSGEP